MNFLKDDILFSRLLQLSILGTLLILLVLTLTTGTEPVGIGIPIASTEVVEKQAADTVKETAHQFWLHQPLNWLQEHVIVPLREWN